MEKHSSSSLDLLEDVSMAVEKERKISEIDGRYLKHLRFGDYVVRAV